MAKLGKPKGSRNRRTIERLAAAARSLDTIQDGHSRSESQHQTDFDFNQVLTARSNSQLGHSDYDVSLLVLDCLGISSNGRCT